MSELICVGSIAGAFGVKGEVRIKSYTADPLAIADYAPLLTQDSLQTFDIVITGQTKNGLTARMSGVVSKEDADALKGTQLFAPRDRLPETEEDEYYYADLINLSVYDTGGTLLGTVKSVQNHGASDLLEIKIADRSLTALLPFTKAAVPTVDIASGRIIADPPSGVFPDDDTK